jgi:DNA-directed RNA polymerase beta subunit
MIAVYNEFKDQSYCPMCGDNVEISDVEISYAFKLMLEELKSFGIYPNLKLKPKY